MGMFETVAELSEARGKAIGEASGEARGKAIGEAKGESKGKARAFALSKRIIKALQAGKRPEAIAKECDVDVAIVLDLKDTVGL